MTDPDQDRVYREPSLPHEGDGSAGREPMLPQHGAHLGEIDALGSTHCFVEFRVNNPLRFASLCSVFGELRHDKRTDSFRDDSAWLAFFDEDARSHFWWPTEAETQAWLKRWNETPLERRWTDPTLRHGWDFFSMIDSFKNGEYELIDCRMVSGDIARIEFDPQAYPFGGTGCMQALVEAFGFKVTGVDDGTGYESRD